MYLKIFTIYQVVVIGDSIPKYVGDSNNEAERNRFVYSYTYRGKGISQIADCVYNLSRAVVDLQADIVYVLLDTNNICGRSACNENQFATAFKEFFDAVNYKFTRAHVIVNIIVPRLDLRPTFMNKLGAFNKVIHDLSFSRGCTIILCPWDTTTTDPLGSIWLRINCT